MKNKSFLRLPIHTSDFQVNSIRLMTDIEALLIEISSQRILSSANNSDVRSQEYLFI